MKSTLPLPPLILRSLGLLARREGLALHFDKLSVLSLSKEGGLSLLIQWMGGVAERVNYFYSLRKSTLPFLPTSPCVRIFVSMKWATTHKLVKRCSVIRVVVKEEFPFA